MLPTLVSFVPVSVLSILLWTFKYFNIKFCEKIRIGYNKLFFWNFYTRAVLEGCLDISLLAAMDLEHNDRDLGWGQTVSFALSVTLLTVIAFLLIWIKCFLRRYDLKEDSTLHRFGGLYESLIPKKSSIILLEWFIARRLIFVATAYYAMG